MLVPENSFKIVVTNLNNVKDTLKYIECLDGSPCRLNLVDSNDNVLTFKIEFDSKATYKTIDQWFLGSDFSTLLKDLKPKHNSTYLDEDALEGYSIELNANSLWDGNLIKIHKCYWICGK